MENLNRYANAFDNFYPRYTDARYGAIQELVARLDQPGVRDALQSDSSLAFAELLEPLIAIKNYKSQTPFPQGFLDALICMLSIRQTTIGEADIFSNHESLFNDLISVQGFQLPTVSAVFHFCSPESFPIVDRNVEGACKLLKERYPRHFANFDAPRLPTLSAGNKLTYYRNFITFINRVKELQSEYGATPNYRYIDKALMVFGVDKLRNQIEAR